MGRNKAVAQRASSPAGWGTQLARLLALLLLVFVCLQLSFALMIAATRWVNPYSTSFERTQLLQQLKNRQWFWAQQWVPNEAISDRLRRAVIASEDAEFAYHAGVEWDAIEKARQRNERALARARARAERLLRRNPQALPPKPPPIVGGSTITQQLAKNLFLSPERNLPRKAQELLLTYMLEAFLSKERILEIYLNNVEWGSGVFGAQAASQHYFGVDAAKLSNMQAAQLAVLLPAPRSYEHQLQSPYLQRRTRVVLARMKDADLPETEEPAAQAPAAQGAGKPAAKRQQQGRVQP